MASDPTQTSLALMSAIISTIVKQQTTINQAITAIQANITAILKQEITHD